MYMEPIPPGLERFALPNMLCLMNMTKQAVGTVIAVLLLLAWMAVGDARAALQPVNLRCALRVNPLGIGDISPRLSWQLQSTGQLRGETQTAYQIQVGSAPGN